VSTLDTETNFSKLAYRNIIQITIKVLAVVDPTVMSERTTYAPTDAYDVPTAAVTAGLLVAATVALVFAVGAPTTALTVVATVFAVSVARRVRTTVESRTKRRRVATETPA
jgi:hypothetical protein